ncbi:MAG: hypothetical protein ABI868_00775 [Acidobacteriota bacterium]
MTTWRTAAAAATLCLLTAEAAAADDDAATLLRVFLRDGTALVSYGEFARVADRVVFSMPIDSTPNPPLQLADIAADRVDWDRTTRYADAARAARYAETQAESDYILINNSIASALNQVAFIPDLERRLAVVESARKALADWPRNHFNYRSVEIRQMVSMLDESIADLRASAGGNRFELSLVATGEAPAATEALLPPPTAVEIIEQLLSLSRLADSAVDRQSFLTTVLVRLDRDAADLPAAWAAETRATTRETLDADRRVERSYQTMIARLIEQADKRARLADVRGVGRVLDSLRTGDQALGGARPDAIAAAHAAIEARLEAARQLRLARDRWERRVPILARYGLAIGTPIAILRNLQTPLEDIKEQAGSTQAVLASVPRRVARILKLVETIDPPEECQAAHALLVSAAHLARNAAAIREEAARSGDSSRAQDASSAAAGALMLSARARTEILSLLRPPQLK